MVIAKLPLWRIWSEFDLLACAESSIEDGGETSFYRLNVAKFRIFMNASG